MNLKEPKVSLSVVIIALNEESNITRAIKSAQWASEIIVYDSGSLDQTKDIALNLGAKVVTGEWLGFGPTKQKATSLASFDWILSIDADEEISLKLAEEIAFKLPNLSSDAAYRIPRISFYLNRWIKYGGWYPDLQTRLFNRQTAGWSTALIHEKVEANKYETLLSSLNHYVFKNIEHQVQTNNKYSTLQANEMFKNRKNFSWFHFFTKPTVKFIECYFLKMGILDGWPGFVIARNAAHSVFMKWAKLKELQMKAGE